MVDKLGLDRLKSLILGSNDSQQEPLTQADIKKRYNDFFVNIAIFLSITASLGYLKHTKTRRVEDFIGVLLKRKLFGELVYKDYGMFLAKGLSPTMISQRVNSNVTNFTYGIVDCLTGIFRGGIMLLGGSALLLIQLPLFSLHAACLVAALGLGSTIFMSRIYKATKEQTESFNAISAYIADQMQNMQQLKILGIQAPSEEALGKNLLKYHKKMMSVSRLWALNMSILESRLNLHSACGLGGLLMIVAEGCYRISVGEMPAEQIWAVLNTLYIGMGLRGLINNVGRRG